jgi:hypothetical protein
MGTDKVALEVVVRGGGATGCDLSSSRKCNTVVEVPWLPEVTKGHVTPSGFHRECANAT